MLCAHTLDTILKAVSTIALKELLPVYDCIDIKSIVHFYTWDVARTAVRSYDRPLHTDRSE